jgi:predicted DNA-binding WGR domain protein
MTAVHIRRVDPARNMRRFYRLDVQPDLFGWVLLVKERGRIDERGRMVAEPSSWLELQNILDDAVGELTFRRGGVRHAAETSQPIISRSKASQARRARSTSLCET